MTAVTLFQAVMAVPGRVIPNDPEIEGAVLLGERRFQHIGCASCHVPALPLDRQGSFLWGVGRVWVDEFELSITDQNGVWQPIEIANSGFEQQDHENKPLRWSASSPGYSYRLVPEPHKDRMSVVIESVFSRTPGNLYPVGWSGDSAVVYAIGEDGRSISAIPAAGGEATTILSDWPKGLRLRSASVTPGGRRFVLSLDETRSDVWIVDNFDPKQ